MDILWAMSHSTSPLQTSTPFSAAAATLSLTGPFSFPTPGFSDGSWDLYEDFVGGIQFWGYALVSGSGDGGVRMWDSAFFLNSFSGWYLIGPFSAHWPSS